MKNKKLTYLFIYLFIAVSTIDIIGVVLNLPVLQAIFKPMIMLSLIGAYYFSTTKRDDIYILAMACSFLGDVLLMDKNNMFLSGIAAFLIAQVLYIIIIRKQLKKSTLKQKVTAIIPFAIYIFILLMVLKDGLDEFLVPVIAYAITIGALGYISLLNYLVDQSKTAKLLAIGVVIFIISDTMIALNKFHEERAFYPVLIMITYVIAQYLIFTFMVQKAKEKSIEL